MQPVAHCRQASSSGKYSRTRLAEIVRRHRDETGVSWRAFAKSVGCTENALRTIASGRTRNVSLDVAVGIARVTGCKVEDLY
jgi:DNA-binding XRE family transcriptional regulator